MLQKEEKNLFEEILMHRVHELENQIKAKKRSYLLSTQAYQTLPEMGVPSLKKETDRRLEQEIRELEEELERFQQAWKAIASDRSPPFVWDMAFVEIFEDENPGFDIVIGNPPYVRQERIQDYLGRFDRREYLHRLNEGLRAIYPSFMGRSRQIRGRADYYVYFYLHALSLLADGGSFCFITSNSWLDVDFGKDLQEFFLRFGHLKMVIDNRAKRSFARADVNTVIVLAGSPERRRPLSEDEMKRRPVHFVAFRVPFEEAMSPVVFSEIEDEGLYDPLAGFRVLHRPEFRAILTDQWSLYQEGLAEPEEEAAPSRGRARRRMGCTPTLSGVDLRPYAGNKWGGKYLRAPDIFFTILEKGKDKLVRLGDIAEVRFGIKTGANEFFYLEPLEMTVKEVVELRERDPMALVRVKNGAGWEGEVEATFLRPMFFSLKETSSVRPDSKHFRYCVFCCSLSLEDLNKQGYKYALAYVEAHAGKKVKLKHGGECLLSQVPSLRGRNPWYLLPVQQPPHFIVNRFCGDRFVFLEGGDFLVCDVFFVGYLQKSERKSIITALLNSTLTALFGDVLARKTYGIGVAYLYGPEINSLLILNPDVLLAQLSEEQCCQLLNAFESLTQRPVRSIFEELGFELCRKRKCDHPEHPYENVRPEALTLEQVRAASPDRFELDRVVFDALGLTDEERVEVYRAVAQLVKDRLLKARNV
jgi:hypothetical protein